MEFDIYLIRYLPLILMGLLCGFVRFIRAENELINTKISQREKAKLKRTRFIRCFEVVLTSAITGFIIFGALSHWSQFSYMVRIALSAAVALYGVDKVLDIAQRVLSMVRKDKNV